ncbi:MAG: hypothetical protein N2644_01660 [Candidatus Sumerlaea chitinivorans]|nr:hypothetical protein [Candidatus Sumerlaea chitinivorans]
MSTRWEEQMHLRERWLRLLGPMPQRVPLEVEVQSIEEQPDHRRVLLIYATEKDARTEAYLLEPLEPKAERLPAAVVFHATTDAHIRQPVGLASAPTRHLGLALVRRGFVVLCPKCFIYGYRGKTWLDAVAELELVAPGLCGMGKMLWDGMRAVDVLMERGDVLPGAIAAVGHSLGAKETLYLAAFDERVCAAVASEGGIALGSSNWDASWYLGERVEILRRERRDHDDLLLLGAPRPFLIVGGGSADGPLARELADRARQRAREWGLECRCEVMLHEAGHDFPETVREQAFDWLENQLGLRAGGHSAFSRIR